MHDLKAELRGEMHSLNGDLRSETADLRGEMHSLIGDLRSETADLRTDITGLHIEMAELRTDMHATINRAMAWMIGTMITLAGVVSGVVIAAH
jgi:hypothetical protein